MSDQYLWDRTGKPDPDVQRLEASLSPLRYDRPAPPFPAARDPRAPRAPGPAVAGPSRWASMAAAAAVTLAVGLAAWWAGQASRASSALPEGQSVAGIAGDLRIEGVADLSSVALPPGPWIETGAQGRARIGVQGLGHVDVAPRSRIRVRESGPARHRLELAVGRITAEVTAPPRLFVVDTPSASAVDLGCAYTLEVDPAGGGRLDVTLGWVGLQGVGGEVIVPAGASCRMAPGGRVGLPWYADAPDPLRAAVEEAASPPAALETVLREARPRDSLTLWYLMLRAEGEARARVYDRLAALCPPPSGVTRELVLEMDPYSLQRWRDRLGWSFFPPDPSSPPGPER